jgi:amidohydrolase
MLRRPLPPVRRRTYILEHHVPGRAAEPLRRVHQLAACWFLIVAAGCFGSQAAVAQETFDVVAARHRIDAVLDKDYPHLDGLYKDIHAHPEVAMQELRTAALLAREMRNLGFTVTEHVGNTGIVAIYRNGPGPTVLVRTELDALPMEEKTGLPYASRARQVVNGESTFVAHMCGHDSHMSWWVGTAATLLALKDLWHGTLMFVGQPAEEAIGGAKAMLADGIFTRFPKPDFGFAAHVTIAPVNTVIIKDGVLSSASDSVEIVFNGRGAGGSNPHMSIDPIVMGAHFVTDVQTVISREKDPQQFGVVTVGAFQAGTVNNIIPDAATLKLTLRSYSPEVRQLLRSGVERTARAVAAMAHAPEPSIKDVRGTAPMVNDSALVARSTALLRKALGEGAVDFEPAYVPGSTASDDYSEFMAAGVPSVFFDIGGEDLSLLADYKARGEPVPENHSPFFKIVPEAAIRTGVTVLTLSVLMVSAN